MGKEATINFLLTPRRLAHQEPLAGEGARATISRRLPKSFPTAVLVASFLGLFMLGVSPTSAQTSARIEIGGSYEYVRTNAPPGGCGCFSLNGGAGWMAYHFFPSLAVVGEVGSGHASDINGTTASLTLTSFLAGPRFSWNRDRRISPFAQLLLGGAHASGALTPNNSGSAGAANAFAMTAGGGVDIGLSRLFALRLVQADYYLTRFDNGVNDHQNNFRIGAGLVFRLGRGK